MSSEEKIWPKYAWVSLILILFFSLWLRAPLINEGLPFLYQEDEAHHFNRVVNMVKEGRYDPEYFHKPSLHFYLRMPVVAASFIWGVKQGHLRSIQEIRTHDPYGLAGYSFTASHQGVVKWNRALSVLMSLAIIGLAFLIVWNVSRSNTAASLAALITAVSPELYMNSAIIGVDVLMSLMCVLAVFAGLYAYKQFSLPAVLLTGVLAGLAVSSKYNALPIVILPLVVILLAGKANARGLMVALFGPAVGFILGTPYALTSLPLFLDHLAYEIWHYGVAGHAGNMAEPGLAQAVFYGKWLLSGGVGVVATLFGMAGVVLVLLSRPKLATILLVFPLLFALLMIAQKTNFTRNVIVMVPFFAVFAGFALSWFFKTAKTGPVISAITGTLALILCIAQPLFSTFEYRSVLLQQDDSRLDALTWLKAVQEPWLDTAVSGHLQLPIEAYDLKGITAVDQYKESPLDFIARGFDRIVLGPGMALSEQEKTFLTLEKEFPGFEGERQRIVKDPQIRVYRVNGDTLASLADRDMQELHCELVFSDSTGKCAFNTSEGEEKHVWVKERLSLIKVSNLNSLKTLSVLPISFNMMSPWPEQSVTFSLGDWSHTVQLDSQASGSWNEVQLDIPYQELKERRGQINIRIDRVHSPRTQLVGLDGRRLGVALKGRE